MRIHFPKTETTVSLDSVLKRFEAPASGKEYIVRITIDSLREGLTNYGIDYEAIKERFDAAKVEYDVKAKGTGLRDSLILKITFKPIGKTVTIDKKDWGNLYPKGDSLPPATVTGIHR